MTRELALARLKANEADLRSKGVLRLRVFGSVARDEAREDSDLDVLADFDPSRRISLLDIVRLERELTEAVGARVDLLEEQSLKPRVRANVLREAVLAF